MHGIDERRRARAALGVLAVVAGLALGVTPALASAVGSTKASQPAAIAAVCEDSGPLTPKGTALISDAIQGALQTTPVPLSLTGAVEAPDEVVAGDTVTYEARLRLDLQALAAEVLEDTIRPAVAGEQPALAPTAALNLRLEDLNARLVPPAGTTIVGTPTASTTAGGPTATASVDAGTVVVNLDVLQANAGSASSVTTTTAPATPAFDIIVGLQVDTSGVPVGTDLDLTPGPIDFAFVGPAAATGGFNVSVSFFGSEVAGGVDGPFGCTVAAGSLATTRVVDELSSSSSESSTSESSSSSSSTSEPTSVSASTTESTSSSSTESTSSSSSTTEQGSRFDNCTEAENAGVTSIPRDSPDYAPALDGNNDGYACEGQTGGNGGANGGSGSTSGGSTNTGTSALARTGVESGLLVGLGLVLVGGGAVVLFGLRRRPHTA